MSRVRVPSVAPNARVAKLVDAPVLETGEETHCRFDSYLGYQKLIFICWAIALKCGRASKSLTGGLETYIACHASIAQMAELQCEELGAVVRIDLEAPKYFVRAVAQRKRSSLICCRLKVRVLPALPIPLWSNGSGRVVSTHQTRVRLLPGVPWNRS